MIERILEMMRKEFRQAFRDPRARVVMIAPPIIQLLVFGFAVNLDVENIRTAWVDADCTPQSRQLRSEFEGSRYFHVLYEPQSQSEIDSLLDHGRVDLVVRVDKGFAADVLRGRTARVQILLDGTNSNTASIVAGYARRLLTQFASHVSSSFSNLPPPASHLQLRPRIWFNANLRSRDYFIPGVIALVITVTTMILTALALVREKEIGTLEQLMVTPLRPVELMLGKTMPFALVGLFDVLLVTALALIVFRVPLRGEIALLFAGAALYVMTTLGIGLFISTVSQTQQQAMMLSFFFTFPIILLSGFAFPIANMPEVIRWLTYLNPMRYFLEIVRAVFLKGVGVAILWPQFAALAVLGVAILGVNSLRFRKRLE